MSRSKEPTPESIAFITTDFNPQKQPPEPNGCAYYRMYLPSRELESLGYPLGFGLPKLHKEQGIGLAAMDGAYFGWDVTMLKLMMHTSVPPAIELMQKRGQKIVVDVDDFHFGIPDENVAADATDPRKNPNSNRMIYEIGIRKADVVTVSTEFLADFYQARCRDVRLVRNYLDCERYEAVAQPEKPVFGWVGATPWRSLDIEILASWLPGFVADHAIQVHHSGHIPGDAKHFGVRAGVPRVSTTPMTSMREYPTLLTKFHVGLVPLVISDFNQSKSYLKGLEYAAAGIPFIATPTREYEILHSYGVGRLASTADEWRDHATQLLDPDVRKEESERQRRIVQEHFDIKGKGEQWASAILG